MARYLRENFFPCPIDLIEALNTVKDDCTLSEREKKEFLSDKFSANKRYRKASSLIYEQWLGESTNVGNISNNTDDDMNSDGSDISSISTQNISSKRAVGIDVSVVAALQKQKNINKRKNNEI